jgi:hypothetical protein
MGVSSEFLETPLLPFNLRNFYNFIYYKCLIRKKIRMRRKNFCYGIRFENSERNPSKIMAGNKIPGRRK